MLEASAVAYSLSPPMIKLVVDGKAFIAVDVVVVVATPMIIGEVVVVVAPVVVVEVAVVVAPVTDALSSLVTAVVVTAVVATESTGVSDGE